MDFRDRLHLKGGGDLLHTSDERGNGFPEKPCISLFKKEDEKC